MLQNFLSALFANKKVYNKIKQDPYIPCFNINISVYFMIQVLVFFFLLRHEFLNLGSREYKNNLEKLVLDAHISVYLREDYQLNGKIHIFKDSNFDVKLLKPF